jgi:predicted MFS family arabinose efflux permease
VASLLTPLGIGAVSLAGLFALGRLQPVTVLLLGGVGLAYAACATSIQNRMFQVAPGSTDVASATLGSGFNAGIATGSLLGGVLLRAADARPLALVGGLLIAVAFVVLAADAARAGRRRPGPPAVPSPASGPPSPST